MLIGEYNHTLDSKHRLSLPAKFRQELGKGLVVTRGLENCLFLFPKASWQSVVNKLQSLPLGSAQARGLARFILGGGSEVEVDKAGRILIPENLQTFAKLGKEIVIAGLSDRVEIWSASAWSEYRKLVEKEAGTMAQALGEVGRF